MKRREIKKIIQRLCDKELSISFAESVTAGMLVSLFASERGVALTLKGCIVPYDEKVKIKLLNVKSRTLRKYTAESQPVTDEMAKGLKALLETDIAVAITGLASPGGSESEEKPVGTVFISIIYKRRLHRYMEVFDGGRDDIRKKAAYMVFEKLQELLE